MLGLARCGIGGLVVALVAGVMGCSSQDPPEPVDTSDRNLWNTAWSEATSSQRAALQDGELTFPEYESAALRTVQCINDAGGMRGEAKFDRASSSYTLGARWESSGSTDDDRRKQEESDACYAEHWNGINQAWAAANQPSEQELIDARAALGDCLRTAGIDIPSPPSEQDIQERRGTAGFFSCLTQVQEEFGIPNFGG